MQSGAHHFVGREIPVVVLVAILALGADVGDVFRDAGRRVEGLAAGAVPAQPAIGLGPYRTRYQLQELRLARAVASHQQPALSRQDAPRHIAQYRAAAAIEIDLAKGYG